MKEVITELIPNMYHIINEMRKRWEVLGTAYTPRIDEVLKYFIFNVISIERTGSALT